MADNAAFGFGTPFAEQLDFFRQKLNLPSERWDDIKKSANDRAFIVAGAGKADLVNDLREAMQKRIDDGKGLQAFRKEFTDVVLKHGWTGWTGEGSKAGYAWRTRIIYQTNMSTSYAAGRWQQLNHPDLLKVRPYWRYHHADGVAHPRPHHLAWNGITLPHDHPFWKTHFAPNGWSCFPGDTPVSGDFELGLKAFYSGQMIEFATRRGHRLTLTVNHPVLTARGWMRADSLREGDAVFACCSSGNGITAGANKQQAVAHAEQVFDTLSGEGLLSVQVLPQDLNGDGRMIHGDIHIAGAQRLFAGNRYPRVFESGCKGLLVGAQAASGVELVAAGNFHTATQGFAPPFGFDAAGSCLAPGDDQTFLPETPEDGKFGNPDLPRDSFGASTLLVHADNLRAQGGEIVAGAGGSPCSTEQLPGVAAGQLQLSPALPHGLALIAPGNTGFAQDAPENGARASVFIGELEQALAVPVSADEIVSIRQFDFSGHVFDFQTSNGLIIASGIAVSNCHCYISAVDGDAYAQAQAEGRGAPPAGWDAVDQKTGAPVGIDKGFDYAPGASVNRTMKDFIDQKLIRLDAPIGAAMWEALAPVLAMERQAAWLETIDMWWADGVPRGRSAVVGALDTATIEWLATNNKPAPSGAEIAIQDRLPLGAKQRRHVKDQNALDLSEWREVEPLLREGDIYFDTGSGHLMFVGDGVGQIKIAVEFDPVKTVKAGGLNQIVTAFRVSDMDVYGMVKGEIWIPVRVR